MKNFDSRTYSINDFLEWYDNDQLVLAPKFQRRSVWTDSARSFLLDTIVQGKPIPKIFIRQSVNQKTRKTIREVVDGQQRLRSVLSYLKDGFAISRKHNKEFGGYFFSQLNELGDETQNTILNYEISVDLLINMSDVEVLDIFSRLNSYSVTLNEQEKINALHFGPFKRLADNIGHELNDFWIKNRILSEHKILRMDEVSLVADLLISITEGIKPKKKIKSYYAQFEREYEHDVDILKERFVSTINLIDDVFKGSLSTSEFKRVQLFYSLFTSFYYLEYGLPGIDKGREKISELNSSKVKASLEKIENIFKVEDADLLSKDEKTFLNDSRRATTDEAVRKRRTEYIIDIVMGEA
ncbi:MAG: DUF262 domain-containing protein [Proteobacteria bacterium]|nr:DUF262 domain-containing protein [Pseudomonadota bacterium]